MTDARGLALIAAHGHEHWWHAGMRQITRSMLAERAAGRALDIGCGPGLDLQDLPPGLVGVGVDIEKSVAVPERFVLADGARTPFACAAFDIVWLMDVLDNPAACPERILVEACRLLKRDGLLFVRVPAYQWLHSRRDEFWGTARRYGRGELAGLVQGAGFAIRRLSYANCLLFAPAAVVRLLIRSTSRGDDEMKPPPALLNSLLRQVLFAEARWLRTHGLPFGLSLVCVATRTG